jgi:hypothetical protein
LSSIAVDPRNSSRWLLGVGNGGVWETKDAGTTWTPMTDEAAHAVDRCHGLRAFQPGQFIYVGTGETCGIRAGRPVGVGVLKSTNGGRT